MVGETIRVEIRRSDPGARRTFALPRRASLVVLDLILAAAREDPSLCYRYSCRSGYCGTCTVALDGHPVLACRTPVPPGARAVEIGPLPGFPIVRDLVVDVRPFTDRWAAAGGRLEPRAPAATPTRSRRFVDEALDCISCGACVAACDLSGADRPFLGPAALTRAMVVIADERTTDRRERLARLGGPEGVEGCRGVGVCSLVCPKGLDPARAIRRLRRWRLAGLP